MALIDLLIEFSLCYHQFIALRTVVYKLRVQKKIRLVIPGVFFIYNYTTDYTFDRLQNRILHIFQG